MEKYYKELEEQARKERSKLDPLIVILSQTERNTRWLSYYIGIPFWLTVVGFVLYLILSAIGANL